MAKQGILLINLGSPKDPTPDAVKTYLTTFLMDPYVVDLPFILRWILVHWLIVPRRSIASAKLYQNIWTDLGSPLLVHSHSLRAKVQESSSNNVVELAMRYGQPSIRDALTHLKDQGIDELVVFPLYPQYARSSTLTCLEEVRSQIDQIGFDTLPSYYLDEFFDQSDFIRCLANKISDTLTSYKPDYLLFSYHGLPEHHLTQDSSQCQFNNDCCRRFREHNPHCYRAQCMETTRLAMEHLNIEIPHSVAFQSRLGRRPWLSPNTEDVLHQIALQGHKKLAVTCPSFVADCLETLEEISLRAEKIFKDAGGEQLVLVPALNDDDDWVTTVQSLLGNRSRYRSLKPNSKQLTAESAVH